MGTGRISVYQICSVKGLKAMRYQLHTTQFKQIWEVESRRTNSINVVVSFPLSILLELYCMHLVLQGFQALDPADLVDTEVLQVLMNLSPEFLALQIISLPCFLTMWG